MTVKNEKNNLFIVMIMLNTCCLDHLTEPRMIEDMKSRAVDEMMERIKKGIILRPILKPAQVGHLAQIKHSARLSC